MGLGTLLEKIIKVITLGYGKRIATWVAKKLGKEDCGCEFCFQKSTNYNGVLEKNVANPFAVATAQAKKLGYDDFKEGSEGDKKRKEIAEALKLQIPEKYK